MRCHADQPTHGALPARLQRSGSRPALPGLFSACAVKRTLTGLSVELVAGAGFEPATFGL